MIKDKFDSIVSYAKNKYPDAEVYSCVVDLMLLKSDLVILFDIDQILTKELSSSYCEVEYIVLLGIYKKYNEDSTNNNDVKFDILDIQRDICVNNNISIVSDKISFEPAILQGTKYLTCSCLVGIQ